MYSFSGEEVQCANCDAGEEWMDSSELDPRSTTNPRSNGQSLALDAGVSHVFKGLRIVRNVGWFKGRFISFLRGQTVFVLMVLLLLVGSLAVLVFKGVEPTLDFVRMYMKI